MTAFARLRTAGVSALFAAVLAPALASANMGNIGTNYGILPVDVGTAQALSLFNTQVSAIYYNPAYLTRDPRGELSLGLLHGDHELRAASQGGAAPAIRQGDVLEDTPTQQQLIGMKTDLSDMLKFDFPVYFAFAAGIEKFGKEMLAFNSRTAGEGQYFSYGRQPLFLNLGGAMRPLHGIDMGASALVTLHATAELQASSDLAGNTRYERLEATAKPSIRPVLGANLDWSDIICGKEECGFLTGLETALSFRGHSHAETAVNSNIVIPGTIPQPGVDIIINTIDSYQPDIYSFGVQYRFSDDLRVAASVEKQNWSDLGEKLRGDTIKDQAGLQFQDITVPRLGVEWRFNSHLTFRGGVAVQDSPLESTSSADVNYLDSDKLIVGLGSTLELQDPPVLAWPLRLDFGYQYQQLEERDFLLSSNNPNNPSPYERLTADGDVHVFSGSMTLKF